MNWKKYRFEVAGVSHYVDDIKNKLSYENDDYSMTAKELSEMYDPGDRVFELSFDDGAADLVPEPTNEYDPNAVRVECGGVLIGYVKKGSCSRVKNLLKSPEFDHIEVEIGGGKYKRLYEDDETGKIKIEKDSCGFFADLYIFTHQDAAPAAPAAPVAPAAPPEPKKGGFLSRLFKK